MELKPSSIQLLIELIQTPSYSGEEGVTADLIESWLQSYKIESRRNGNNVWAVNKYFDSNKRTILLNSHHDTVRPNEKYSRDPFEACIEEGRLYGLGSNDAGGALVSLLATFIHFYHEENLNYNLVIVASAEEEGIRRNGLESVLPFIPPIHFAIVGEPTLLDIAIAERGLLVLDCYSSGKAGHAAHINGCNSSIYQAMQDVFWVQGYNFEKVSDLLGPVKMTVTQINAGIQHNMVPAECHFVIDVRINDKYTNLEILDIISSHVASKVVPRSVNLNSSSININHPIIEAGKGLGHKLYGSPTLSDQAVLQCESLKIGPGDSLRSHSADEFIYLQEISDGIDTYIEMLKKIL